MSAAHTGDVVGAPSVPQPQVSGDGLRTVGGGRSGRGGIERHVRADGLGGGAVNLTETR